MPKLNKLTNIIKKMPKLNKLTNIIKTKPKKTLFKRNRATIILPNKKALPVLRRSEIFNKEYEKEKNLLEWK